MKTKVYNVLALTVTAIVFYAIYSGFVKNEVERIQSNLSSPASTPSQMPKDFTNFILNRGYENTPGLWDMENHLNQYKQLNFNGVHIYDEGSSRLGYFDQPLTSTQINNVENLIYRSDTTGLKSIFQRVKIAQLCYGQRLEYEAEGGNYGFSYQRRSAPVEQDSGKTVVHACTNSTECPGTDAAPRWLCDSIYENMQHTDLYYFTQPQDTGNWHLKPMMRIKQSDFNASSTTPVVAVVTKNFKGHTIDSTIIKIRDFKNSNDEYEGNYINTYNFIDEPPGTDLSIPGSLDSNVTIEGLNYGYGGNTGVNAYNIDDCKVDFKVYWFGQVDVWFDKMTVDDKLANHLFDGTYDYKIKDETTRDNFAELMYFLKKSKTIQSSNYLPLNYVLNKMESYLSEKYIAETRQIQK